MTRLLGAILAGGASRRFGSDKAVALLDDIPLLEHVRAALAPQVDAVVLCGREWPGIASMRDRPGPGLGPLGGLCGALGYARDHGFDEVLTVGCDVLPVPADLGDRLLPGPAVIEGQPLFGRWPSTLADGLERYLAGNDNRSVRAWIAQVGARGVLLDIALHNLNRPADLAAYAAERLAQEPDRPR